MSARCKALAAVACLVAIPAALGLSAPVCDNVAATWGTGTPHLTGSFPYFSLLLFCDGNLNLETLPVASCVDSGAACGQPAADAFCRYLGFEEAVDSLFTIVQADGPARSMTGEWCVLENEYAQLGYLNRTDYDTLNSSISGTFCQRLDSVTCFNSRNALAANNAGAEALAREAALAPTPAPAPQPLRQPPAAAQPPPQLATTFFAAVPPPPPPPPGGLAAVAPLANMSTATGGRRLR